MEDRRWRDLDMANATFHVGGREPCPGGRGECVEARMRSEAEPGDVARIIKRFIGELGMPVAEAERLLGEMSSVTEVAIVTEPARLVPHRLEKALTTRMSPGPGAPPGAKPIEAKSVIAYTSTYAPTTGL